MSAATTEHANGVFPVLTKEEDELVEREVRDRFKKMCEGYFDNVSKKLVIEHKVWTRSRLQALISAYIHLAHLHLAPSRARSPEP